MGLQSASCKRPRCSTDDGGSTPACEDEEQDTSSSIQSLPMSLAARAERANLSRIFSKLEQMVLLLPAAKQEGGGKLIRGSQLRTLASRRLQANAEAGGLSVFHEDAALEAWKVHIKCHTIDVMPEGEVIMQSICDEFERLSTTQDRHSPAQQRHSSTDLLSYGSSVLSCSRRLSPDLQGTIWGGTSKGLTIDVEFEEHFAAILNVE